MPPARRRLCRLCQGNAGRRCRKVQANAYRQNARETWACPRLRISFRTNYESFRHGLKRPRKQRTERQLLLILVAITCVLLLAFVDLSLRFYSLLSLRLHQRRRWDGCCGSAPALGRYSATMRGC